MLGNKAIECDRFVFLVEDFEPQVNREARAGRPCHNQPATIIAKSSQTFVEPVSKYS